MYNNFRGCDFVVRLRWARGGGGLAAATAALAASLGAEEKLTMAFLSSKLTATDCTP